MHAAYQQFSSRYRYDRRLTFRFLKATVSNFFLVASMTTFVPACSRRIRSSAIVRSLAERKRAVAGLLGTRKKATMPLPIEMMPSKKKMLFQPGATDTSVCKNPYAYALPNSISQTLDSQDRFFSQLTRAPPNMPAIVALLAKKAVRRTISLRV